MVTVASIYLRFYIKVGVGVGTFLPTPTPPKIPSESDSDSTALPVSIIPPLLHTHSFIYHQRCITFFSQYFSFPLSVSFQHSAIIICLLPMLFNPAVIRVVKQHA
jgi:hypothetical protein